MTPEFGYSIAELLLGLVNYGYYILFGAIIASILISWLPGYPSSAFMQGAYEAIRAVSGPILNPIRSRLPMLKIGSFGIDLSPIVAIIGLGIVSFLLTTIIQNFIRPITG